MPNPSNPYADLLPPLPPDELERLRADIAEHGVRVAIIVDEDGNILDGRHRWRIAQELGIDCPIAASHVGLPDHEKRLLAVGVNVKRRQLTDAQLTILGELIEPDIAERARRRQVELGRSHGETLMESFPEGVGTTRDDVATEVGLGTGRNYDNKKKVLRDLREHHPDLAAAAATGLIEKPDGTTAKADIKALKKEASRREKEAKKERIAAATTATVVQPDAQPSQRVKPGEWIKLGRHLLYCGDSTSEDFISVASGARFAFADPPYNAGVDDWDHDFEWRHDYLADAADLVIVTPGISAIMDFARVTTMPYRWSIAGYINNGRARSAIGFGNWIYCALFSRTTVYANSQDHYTLSVVPHPGAEHEGRKPVELLAWLLETFTEPEDLVIDPFAGSGTTLLVSDKLGRRCITAELNPDYCAAIVAAYNARDWA